jgi:hypothetical protein
MPGWRVTFTIELVREDDGRWIADVPDPLACSATPRPA